MSPFALRVVFCAMALSLALGALDTTIVATIQPVILGEMHEFHNLTLPSIVYMLASTVTQPISGKLSDIFGRKTVFIVTLALFLIGSALCGAARSFGMFVAARTIQGFGGGLYALVTILLADLCDTREKMGLHLGIMGAVFAIMTAMGPMLGGVFVDQLSWRIAFYINLPFGIMSLMAIAMFLRTKSVSSSSAECDIEGAVGLTLFGLVEVYVAKDPLLPPRIFRVRNIAVMIVMNFSAGVASYGIIEYIPAYWSLVRGYTSTQSGVQLLPFMLAMAVAAVVCGYLVSADRFKISRAVIITGIVVLIGGLAALKVLERPALSIAIHTVILLAAGLGTGACVPTTVTITQAAVSEADVAVATTFINFARVTGGIFGLAIQNTIVFNRIRGDIGDSSHAMLLKAVLAGGDMLKWLPEHHQQILRESFARALGAAFFWTAPLALVGLLACFFLQPVDAAARENTGEITNEYKKPGAMLGLASSTSRSSLSSGSGTTLVSTVSLDGSPNVGCGVDKTPASLLGASTPSLASADPELQLQLQRHQQKYGRFESEVFRIPILPQSITQQQALTGSSGGISNSMMSNWPIARSQPRRPRSTSHGHPIFDPPSAEFTDSDDGSRIQAIREASKAMSTL
ncbi:MFS general substrate transporter [Ramicandelaber brevisporus]|nr:MFS general substrate transporter [Ramicandelaber brevisporus]